MFSDDFLASIDRAEKDVKAGRVHKLKSLKDTVTIRNRDTGVQERVAISDLLTY